MHWNLTDYQFDPNPYADICKSSDDLLLSLHKPDLYNSHENFEQARNASTCSNVDNNRTILTPNWSTVTHLQLPERLQHQRGDTQQDGPYNLEYCMGTIYCGFGSGVRDWVKCGLYHSYLEEN